MPYSDLIINHLQANNILAKNLDHALSGVSDAISDQIKTLGSGAQRIMYYTSCFTDKYQEVCQQQKNEDIRFAKGVYHILRRENVMRKMLKIYFEEIFRYKKYDQLKYIKQRLMAVNVHIATSSFTNTGFALAAAASVAVSMNLKLEISSLLSGLASRGVAAVGIYGVVQKAADSACRLRFYPAYYAALYAQELEMMYFLIEPLFQRTEALKAQSAPDEDIAIIIARMIR